MAIEGNGGLRVSFDCTALIEELKRDISEFGGDTPVDVVMADHGGVTVYKDYNFTNDNSGIGFVPLPDEKVVRMTAAELLAAYERQNEIF